MKLAKPFETAIALALAAALTACSTLPIPATVDLLDHVGDASGSVDVEIGAGEARDVDLTIPTDEGQCIPIDEGLPVTVESANLHWVIDAEYDGPELSGMLQARIHVAGAGDDLFASQHRLGPTFTLNLDRTVTRLAGSAPLNPTQLRAINDHEVCWGVEITGRDVSAAEDGTATIRYSVEQLWLRVRFSVI